MLTTDPAGPALIALWSAPRCRSTAFLRMMTERADRMVVHEPFSQLSDFGGFDLAGTRVTTEDALMDRLLELSRDRPVFFKDTTDFRYPRLLERVDFLRAVTHSVIVRDPTAAIASHLRLNPAACAEEIGFGRLAEIYRRARDVGGDPVVIDSDELVERPDAVVRAYCAAVGIPFLPHALRWAPGQRPEWTATGRWHEATSGSTGFGAGPDATGPAPSVPAALLAANLPPYRQLRERRLQIDAPAGTDVT